MSGKNLIAFLATKFALKTGGGKGAQEPVDKLNLLSVQELLVFADKVNRRLWKDLQ